MRKVVLFIAMSLDEYIADMHGSTAWLEGQITGENDMVSYEEFIQDVDTVIMGANTYHQLATELSPSGWVYSDLTSYIITHNPKKSSDIIKFTNECPCQLVTRLKNTPGQNIWICGGASIVKQLMQANLIEQYYINVIPTILGNGIRLFGEFEEEMKLKLIKTRNYNGITDLVYERRQSPVCRGVENPAAK